MTSLKDLSDSEIDVVHEWLRTMGMPVTRKIHRDYSDGVLVAKLMKKLYPRLIETQEFQTHYGYDLKIVNWQMLQFKVFNRIGLPLTRRQIHALATGEKDVLEKFLWELMMVAPKKTTPTLNKLTGEFNRSDSIRKTTSKLPDQKPKEKESSGYIESDMNSDGMYIFSQKSASSHTVVPAKQSANKIIDLTEQGMVPFTIYEDVVNEVQMKDNTIKAYQTKVAILERIIQERDTEIFNLKHKVH